MKKILCILLLFTALCATQSSQAQNLKKYYTSHVVDDGIIYHLFSQALFSNEKYGDLSSDITYKTKGNNRATFNFTYLTPAISRADSVRLVFGKRSFVCPVKAIYIERSQKNWAHRYTCTIDLPYLQEFFGSDSESMIKINSGNNTIVYKMKKKDWGNYAPIATSIFQTISYNE